MTEKENHRKQVILQYVANQGRHWRNDSLNLRTQFWPTSSFSDKILLYILPSSPGPGIPLHSSPSPKYTGSQAEAEDT